MSNKSFFSVVPAILLLLFCGREAHAQYENPAEAVIRHFLDYQSNLNGLELVISTDRLVSVEPIPHEPEFGALLAEAASALDARLGSFANEAECPPLPPPPGAGRIVCTMNPGIALITVTRPTQTNETEMVVWVGAQVSRPVPGDAERSPAGSTGGYEYRIRHVEGMGWIAEQTGLISVT